MNENYEVVVVGGGVAGLTAAADLVRAGLSVVLLEARQRLGGRLFSSDYAPGDSAVEFGGAYLALDQQPVLRELIERTGTQVRPRLTSNTSAWVIEGVPTQLNDMSPTLLLELERLAFRLMAAADRFSLESPVWEQDIADLDIPFAEFLEAETGRTPATDVVAGFFTQLAGANADTVSALWPIGLVAWRNKSLLAMLSSRIFEFTHGSAELIESLAGTAGTIVLGEAVTSITQSASGVRVRANSGREWSAKQVVIAVPVNTLGQITFSPALPAEVVSYLEQGHPGAGIKILMRVRGVTGHVSVTGLTKGFRHVTTVADEGEMLMLAGFGLHSELDTSSLAAVEAALRLLLPDARLVSFRTHDWVADPWSQGTWMVYRPGEALRIPELMNRDYGRLFFAGSDVADQWSGNIEGAARSGCNAAARILGKTNSKGVRGAHR